jgi:hypothetical protein
VIRQEVDAMRRSLVLGLREASVAEVAYASPRQLVLQAFEGLLPPERIDVPAMGRAQALDEQHRRRLTSAATPTTWRPTRSRRRAA